MTKYFIFLQLIILAKTNKINGMFFYRSCKAKNYITGIPLNDSFKILKDWAQS